MVALNESNQAYEKMTARRVDLMFKSLEAKDEGLFCGLSWAEGFQWDQLQSALSRALPAAILVWQHQHGTPEATSNDLEQVRRERQAWKSAEDLLISDSVQRHLSPPTDVECKPPPTDDCSRR
jgi:hypothetical protein